MPNDTDVSPHSLDLSSDPWRQNSCNCRAIIVALLQGEQAPIPCVPLKRRPVLLHMTRAELALALSARQPPLGSRFSHDRAQHQSGYAESCERTRLGE
jgi:hypothetical protein